MSRLFLPVLAALYSQAVYAGVVTIDFDALDTSSGALSGEPVAVYLAGYGVSIVDASSGSRLSVNRGEGWLSEPSFPNSFTLIGPGAAGNSFTFSFSQDISDFSLVRAGFIGSGSPNGNLLGPWSASAFDASHQLLGTIGESLSFSYGDIPMQTFRLTYPGIRSVVFYGNALGQAGVQMPYIDDISFTLPDEG